MREASVPATNRADEVSNRKREAAQGGTKPMKKVKFVPPPQGVKRPADGTLEGSDRMSAPRTAQEMPGVPSPTDASVMEVCGDTPVTRELDRLAADL